MRLVANTSTQKPWKEVTDKNHVPTNIVPIEPRFASAVDQNVSFSKSPLNQNSTISTNRVFGQPLTSRRS